jgi:hypothetical protein
MPTEDDARLLLAKAAATIEVAAAAPMNLTGLPEPHARRWPVLAAAAAVVGAIGGGYLVAQQLGDDPTPASDPAVDRTVAPSDGPVVLDDDQLPSLIGYTEDEAIELVQSRGYAVQVHVVPDGCDLPGIVTGTNPAAGTRMNAGDTVTIRVVGQQDVIDCVGELPWDTIWATVRSAQGLDVASDELDGVEIPVDVRDAFQQLLVGAGLGEGSPAIRARWTFDDARCTPDHVPGDDRLRIWVGIPIDGPDPCPATSLLLRFDQHARLVAVELDEEVLTTEELGASLNRLPEAKRFVAWARGEGPAPEFTDRVRVMFSGGGAFGSTGWTSSPEVPLTYGGCSGLGFPECFLNPVGVIHRYEGPVVATAGRSTCADGGVLPKRFAEAEEDIVRLEEPEPGDCTHAWAVELWINQDGVIYGVNQAGGG